MYPRVLEAFQDADDIFPVVSCLALVNDVVKGIPPLGEVVAVDVFEGEGDVAKGDFDCVGFESGFVCGRVDELFLLGGQMAGEEDLGVEDREERDEVG